MPPCSAFPTSAGASRCAAVVEPRRGAALDGGRGAGVVSRAARRLQGARARVELVAELPRDPNGKVLKRQLREPYWAGRERRV